MKGLAISQSILEELRTHARECDPYECCGLLAGQHGRADTHYRITNTVAKNDQASKVFSEAKVKDLNGLSEHNKAEVAYFMDPKELAQAFKDMRSRHLDLLGIYHSHTHSPAYPSETDVGLAYYPDAAYVIISLENKRHPTIRAFTIRDKQVHPLPITSL